jgi:hypothetical protein
MSCLWSASTSCASRSAAQILLAAGQLRLEDDLAWRLAAGGGLHCRAGGAMVVVDSRRGGGAWAACVPASGRRWRATGGAPVAGANSQQRAEAGRRVIQHIALVEVP